MIPWAVQVQHVQQPSARTCGHACAAMVTGIPVSELVKRFGEEPLYFHQEATILTEMGILPIQMPMSVPLPFCLVGAYYVAVPSLNIPGDMHRVVVTGGEVDWKVYDPNEGRAGKRYYARDAMNPRDGQAPTINPAELYFLMPLQHHRGTDERMRRYQARRLAAEMVRA